MKKKLDIKPLVISNSKINGLQVINSKMVTDNRGTVREL